jgi:hypothetical protein
MPHDAKGKKLKAGDTVVLPCKIKSISEGETACNVCLEAIGEHAPGEYKPVVSCNSKHVELLPDGPALPWQNQ